MEKTVMDIEIERCENGMYALKICDEEGRMIRYYGMIDSEEKRIYDFAEKLRNADISVMHLDYYMDDFNNYKENY